MKPPIYYLYYGRYPSEKAHSLYLDEVANAFHELGHQVTVVVPEFSPDIPERPFGVVKLPVYNYRQAKAFRHFWFHFGRLQLLRSARRLLAAQPAAIIFTNDLISILAGGKKDTVCYELHDFPEQRRFLYRFLLGQADRILVTNQVKEEMLHQQFPSLRTRTFVEPNGVDVDQFKITLTRAEARLQLGLPPDDTIVLYTGHLYSWKGVDTLAAAAALLPPGQLVFFVGGTSKDSAAFKKRYKQVENLIVIGHRPHHEMPVWQQAADVLVIPNTGKEAISKFYTSPMKLFEYLASDRPIIASDLPSIREIADERLVTYIPPDDPQALADSILRLTTESPVKRDPALTAQFLAHYSWAARARRILKIVVTKAGT